MNFAHQKLLIEDFDQLSEVLKGWQTEPVQLSPGPLDLSVESTSDQHFSVLRLSLSPRISDRAVTSPGIIGFVLVESPHTWCGVELVPPAIFLTRAGRETRSVLENDFRSLEFYFPEEVLAEHSLGLLLRRASLDPEQSVYPISIKAAERLRSLANAIFSWTDDMPGQSGTDMSFSARSRLLNLLEGILAPYLGDEPPAYPLSRPQARFDLTVAALDDIDNTGAAQTSVSEIYRRLGVSRRALEQAFTSTLGISPGQYLLACRLNHARSHLVTKAHLVVEAAMETGFQDLSRFAYQYRRLFGELPSQTLERYHRRIPS
jgi:AraC family ethanolamine operon transcriptional activator